MTALHSLRGANFWSQRPVPRMDLVVGQYDQIFRRMCPDSPPRSSAPCPPHRAPVQYRERGAFSRDSAGDVCAHIIEHVALELQAWRLRAGYGKTRGGDQPGEYTLVSSMPFNAGLRAAALALEVVQRASPAPSSRWTPPFRSSAPCSDTGRAACASMCFADHRRRTRHERGRDASTRF